MKVIDFEVAAGLQQVHDRLVEDALHYKQQSNFVYPLRAPAVKPEMICRSAKK
jgi:hypothetical protein